jgi:hypothetical protein
VKRLGAGEWVQVFELFTSGRIPREAIAHVAGRMAADGVTAEAAAAAEGVALQPREHWRQEADQVTLDGYHAGRNDSPERRLRFLAGRAVRMLRGRAPAAEVAAYLRGALGEAAR